MFLNFPTFVTFVVLWRVHDSTRTTRVKLFLGINFLTPFQHLVLAQEISNRFVCVDLKMLVKAALRKLKLCIIVCIVV